MRWRLQLACSALILALPPAFAFAWNIPGHMIICAIAYQTLQGEQPKTATAVTDILEKHPWYADRWQADLDALPEPQRTELLFMLAARWADDIRTKDRSQHRGPWHYINWPF